MSSSLSTLTIYIVGLSNTEAAVFAAVTRILRLQKIQLVIAVKPDKHCQLIIIHSDTERGQTVLNQLKTKEIRQHVLLIGNHKPDLSTIKTVPSFIAKPLRVHELRECLEKIHDSLTLNPSNQLTDKPKELVTAKKPAQVLPIGSFASQILLSPLLSAKNNHLLYQITNKNHEDFWVNGIQQAIYSNYSSKEFAALINDFHKSGYTILPISSENFKVITEHKKPIKLREILWYAACADKRGKLITGLNDESHFKLISWPNMTRMNFDPSHLRIASALSRGSITVIELLQRSELPRSEVVCFLNAAYCTNYIKVLQSDEATKTTTTKTINKNKNSLLSKIALHLHIKL